MRLLVWISLALTVLLGADGLYMTATGYHPKDVNNFNLSDGGTVLIAALLMLIVAAIAFFADHRQATSGGPEAKGRP